jgi:hypothetical protein
MLLLNRYRTKKGKKESPRALSMSADFTIEKTDEDTNGEQAKVAMMQMEEQLKAKDQENTKLREDLSNL